MTEKREFTWFDFIFRNFLIAIGLRMLLQAFPGLPTCTLFWAYLKFGDPVFLPRLTPRRRALHFIAFIGSTMNAIAMLANGGCMPVLGKTTTNYAWAPLTAHSRFVFLCDIHSGSSLGDFFIIIALAGFLLNWLLEKSNRLKVSTHGERMPGLGF